MRKALFSLLIVWGITTAAQAQNVRYGLKAGGNLTRLTSRYTIPPRYADGDNNLKLGFHGGGVVNIGLGDLFSIQPEVLFSMKQYGFPNIIIFKKLNYIDIPLLLKVSAKGLFFEAGPQVSFVVGRTYGYANSLDIGYAAGLGYQLASGFNAGLRYNGGISKVYDIEFRDNNANTIGYYAPRNQNFQLYVGYLLRRK